MREQKLIQVKIVEFSAFCKGRGERALEALVNQGWRIVAAGGSGTFPSYIVILQRDAPSGSMSSEAGFPDGDYLA
jgi:hypothetical protein